MMSRYRGCPPRAGSSPPASMSQASNCWARCLAAAWARSGRPLGGMTWMRGSRCRIRARGSTSQIASIPAIARRTGKERDLVDRGVERDGVAVVRNEPGRGRAVAGEALDEAGAEEVHVLGPAVVAEVPQDLDALPLGR